MLQGRTTPCVRSFGVFVPKRFERNGAKRWNDWNVWNGPIPMMNGRTLGGSGTRAALELLEPMEPYVSDNDLNGAKRLNYLNGLNGLR